ncbi:T7SS effector LXG polymorphic toxin [Bacillus manliponensis]|uniref:T7SS effector LXG polymorphic toxin n=1 Tax=Bacillus manliponensis TaxID=574376 RepID=UPI003518DE20
MSLNMYVGEVQAQTESMNAFCNATIQGMEEVIRSIDSFAGDVMLQGKTYDSAKIFFVQTYRQLAQGIIYLCEELIRQNNAFPADFQAEVATVDVIEQEIREQIRELERMIAAIEAMSEETPGAAAMLAIYHAMKRKLEDKLERLYNFNYPSSENYRTAFELAASIAKGLAEVQSGKGFQAGSGTFHTDKLNMEWAKPIQVITEEKIRQAQIEEKLALKEREANKPWYQKTAISAWEYIQELKDSVVEAHESWYQKTGIGAWEYIQGLSNSVAEANIGLEIPMGDELENKKAFQIGNLTGNVLTGFQAVAEVVVGTFTIGGSNAGTAVVGVGTGGLALPVILPANAAITVAAGGMVTHGGFVWYNTIQNGRDTIQKFQSSSGTNGTGNGNLGSRKNTNVDNFDAKTATNKQKGNYGEIKSNDNLLNNQSLKDAGFDLKPVGKAAPSSIDDKIVKGIDGLYENTNAESKIKYVIDEAKFGSSQLGKTKDGTQMSNDWLTGTKTEKSRILKAVDGDEKLARKITGALKKDQVERVLSKVDSSGNVKTYRIDAKGDIIGEWP